MSRSSLLTQAEKLLLWKSIEEQSGEDGSWLNDFEEAAAAFRRQLIARGNLYPPTSFQLRGWFERSATRHADPPCRTKDIFRFGPGPCNIPRSAADHLTRRTQPANASAIANIIGNEGLVSRSPCVKCVKAKRDCLVHPDYLVCQRCTRNKVAARACQASGTRGFRSEQAQSPHRDEQNQKR